MSLSHVQAALRDPDIPSLARMHLVDPVPGEPRGDKPPGDWEPDALGLPPGCPVIPLGTEGDLIVLLDTLGQIRKIGSAQFGQGTITSLFAGRIHYLYWAWPRIAKGGEISFRAEKVRESLQTACAIVGLYRGDDAIRGRGCWPGPDGTLIYHAGNRVYVDRRPHAPGMIDGYVYPAGAELPIPAQTGGVDVARAMLAELDQWCWGRPGLDQMLLLGWLAQARVAAATRWRPSVIVSGEAGSGKSTLQDWVRATLAPGIIATANASAAGLWQSLGHDSLPVLFDEAEAGSDTRKGEQLVELMRASASGDTIRRGGENHRAHSFRMITQFMLSAVTPMALKPQDRSRIVSLGLLPIPGGKERPNTDADRLNAQGRALMRQIMDQWDKWPARLRAWRSELRAMGADDRVADTYAHLLGMADLVLSRVGMLEDGTDWPCGAWVDQLAPIVANAMVEREPAWQVCLQHLMSKRPGDWRPEGFTSIGEALRVAHMALTGAGLDDRGKPIHVEDQQDAEARAKRALASAGLGVHLDRVGRVWLCLPNRNARLQALFAGTEWHGLTAQRGIWCDTLARVPAAYVLTGDQARFRLDGAQTRGVMVDLSFILGEHAPDPLSATHERGGS